MAWDAYLVVAGITGESKREGHEGEIEIISFSFGGSNPSSVGLGGGGGTGTVSLSSFNIMKKTDATSCEMFQAMCTGEHFDEAVLVLYKSGGKAGALPYLVYTFEENIPMESVSFSFGRIEITYTEQNEDGTAGGDHQGMWDVRAGVAK